MKLVDLALWGLNLWYESRTIFPLSVEQERRYRIGCKIRGLVAHDRLLTGRMP